jgi:hypothetical protein
MPRARATIQPTGHHHPAVAAGRPPVPGVSRADRLRLLSSSVAIFGRKCRHSAPIDGYPSGCCRCLAFFRGHGRQRWRDSRRNWGASHIWDVFHEFFVVVVVGVVCALRARSCDLNKPSSQRERGHALHTFPRFVYC